MQYEFMNKLIAESHGWIILDYIKELKIKLVFS